MLKNKINISADAKDFLRGFDNLVSVLKKSSYCSECKDKADEFCIINHIEKVYCPLDFIVGTNELWQRDWEHRKIKGDLKIV